MLLQSPDPQTSTRRQTGKTRGALVLAGLLIALLLACGVGVAYAWLTPRPVRIGPYTVHGPGVGPEEFVWLAYYEPPAGGNVQSAWIAPGTKPMELLWRGGGFRVYRTGR